MRKTGETIKITTLFADGEDITDRLPWEAGDIILMDIQMRFMDGMTAAEKNQNADHEGLLCSLPI